MAKQKKTINVSLRERLADELGSGHVGFFADVIAARLGCRTQQVSDLLNKMDMDGDYHVVRRPLGGGKTGVIVRPQRVVSDLWRLALGVRK